MIITKEVRQAEYEQEKALKEKHIAEGSAVENDAYRKPYNGDNSEWAKKVQQKFDEITAGKDLSSHQPHSAVNSGFSDELRIQNAKEINNERRNSDPTE